MSRGSKKPTIKQLEARVAEVEGYVVELQQAVGMIIQSASNDLIRHDNMLKDLCDESDKINFVKAPEPEGELPEGQEQLPIQDANIEVSDGE